MAISRPRYNQKKKRRTNKFKTGSRYKQGYYYPKHPEKFKASLDETMNSAPVPFYRSSWELKFYRWCDENDDIEYWGTESIAIKYYDPQKKKMRRYYPDVFLKFKDNRMFIIEIKPAAQNNNPTNIAKWEAARIYAEKVGATFLVMNEKDLGV
jgi:hypothetical protein